MMRYYYRCHDCLSVCATEVDVMPYGSEKVRCSACDGLLESLGQVQRDRLVHFETRSVCDCRCTSARGPKCDCQCGGENHGSGLTVTVTRDAGAVPSVDMLADDRTAQRAAFARATEYRQALESVYNVLRPLREAKRRGEYLSDGDFRRMLSIEYVLRAAYKSRIHKSRIAKLRSVLAQPESAGVLC